MLTYQNLTFQKTYDIVEFIGYRKAESIRHAYSFKDDYIVFNLKHLLHYKTNEYGVLITDTRQTIDYRYFIQELTKLHPQKMREWKIKNIINK